MAETNYLQQLVDYIKKNLSKGYPIESLKWALIKQDYSRTSVEKAMELAVQELAKEAPVIKEKPVIKIEYYKGAQISQSEQQKTDANDNISSKPLKSKLKEFFE